MEFTRQFTLRYTRTDCARLPIPPAVLSYRNRGIPQLRILKR